MYYYYYQSIINKVLEISAKCACFFLVLKIRTGDLKFVLLWNFRIYVEPESNQIESNRIKPLNSVQFRVQNRVQVWIWFRSYSYRREVKKLCKNLGQVKFKRSKDQTIKESILCSF